ncbi:MAG TPA: hypothetical protein VJG31_02165, partial [Candidatus Nanoarchaeia archaeon]|nr:hypothetical protein [Candidatus Nanoarchaeia archaeon]
MLPRTEISKNHQLNDVVLDLQEGIPALDGYTGEDESGVRIVIQDFLFSASYRVGEQALLARPEDFGGIVFFDGANIAGTKTMTKDRAKNYTLQYLRHQGFLRDYGDNKYRDLHARLYLLGIRT